jgi:hypothetical protein
MHAEELQATVGSPVPKSQVIEGFGNACSEAETTAKNLKKKTKAEPVFVVLTGDPDPQTGIRCPPGAEPAYQCAFLQSYLISCPPGHTNPCHAVWPIFWPIYVTQYQIIHVYNRP